MKGGEGRMLKISEIESLMDDTARQIDKLTKSLQLYEKMYDEAVKAEQERQARQDE